MVSYFIFGMIGLGIIGYKNKDKNARYSGDIRSFEGNKGNSCRYVLPSQENTRFQDHP